MIDRRIIHVPRTQSLSYIQCHTYSHMHKEIESKGETRNPPQERSRETSGTDRMQEHASKISHIKEGGGISNVASENEKKKRPP